MKEKFQQLSIFDLVGNDKKPFKITKPVRLIELFGGIGTQAMSLRDLGVSFESYRLIDFDQFACKSYNAIHGTNFKDTDITTVHGTDLGIEDTDKYTYILTYSFPCQSLSVAGKMEGMSKGSGTRSGLLWEVERILTEIQAKWKPLPDVLLLENVTQVHATKNEQDWNDWLKFLSSLGYTNFWKDMNAKNYGIAQNRNRTFCVSILGDYDYKFPEPIELTTVMKDYLEESVDEKFYINSDRAKQLIEKLIADGKLENPENPN